MSGFRPKGWVLAAVCAVTVALGAGAAPAQGETDPLFLYVPVPKPPKALHPPPEGFQPPAGPSPTGYFNGPCGLAVDSGGRFYLSDYYHDMIDVYSTFKREEEGTQVWRPSLNLQLSKADPLDGPCGLALGGENLYVNYYHQYVARFSPAPFFGERSVIDSAHPTGVAVDPATGDVYVDDRTYIAVYKPSGAPVEVGGEPLRIGQGNLEDGYGVAVSSYPGRPEEPGVPGLPSTAGYVYVPDAATDTVKVYDPATDAENPIATIDGHEVPGGAFVSLRDSAVAVDDVTGEVYVADDLQPLYAEQPQAAIYVFGPAGDYEGHLKYDVSDAKPPGLAVDNSGTGTQSRVYVTSGNTTEAGVYGYTPGAATTALPLPGWPVGGCAGIFTCIETTGGSSSFGGVPAAALSSASVPAEAASAAAAAAADVAPRRRRGNSTRHPRGHRRHRGGDPGRHSTAKRRDR